MAKREPEELLRALASAAEEGEGVVGIEPATLDGYRAGTLGVEEEAAVERALGDDPAARAALAARAGVVVAPSPAVRQAVVESVTSRPRGRGSWWGLGLAAMFVGALFAAQLTLRPDHPLPEIEASIENPSVVRSAPSVEPAGAGRWSGAAGDPVKLTFRPTFEADLGIDIGLYRRRGTVVERIDDEAWVTADTDATRSAGTLLAHSAGDLVGDGPGVHTIWLVVARRGDLPETIELEHPRNDLARDRLADGDRRSPLEFTVDIVSDVR